MLSEQEDGCRRELGTDRRGDELEEGAKTARTVLARLPGWVIPTLGRVAQLLGRLQSNYMASATVFLASCRRQYLHYDWVAIGLCAAQYILLK
jgi:hypothetical protein